ncbi:MAG: DUF3106 domain-containing protein [Bryobacterales bacterium]|nr:DUF3106 domain-containing protein [Bryobacterales bacterium]
MRLGLLTLTLAIAAGSSPQAQTRPRVPPNRVERFRQLTPDQRKKALESLPPGRRQQAEQRLQQLDTLPPAERDALDRRYEAFQNLPFEQQQLARQVFRKLNALPLSRREALRAEMDTLRRLPPQERSGHLLHPALRKRFSSKERAILNDFSSFLSTPDSPDLHF